MQQAIITGSTGFIGSHFVDSLTQTGISVLALGRKPYSSLSALKQRLLSKAVYKQLDMKEIHLVKHDANELMGTDLSQCVFINLAWGGVDRLSDLNINAQMNNVSWSVSALNVAKEIGCKKFVQIGTMEEAFTNKYLDLDHNVSSEYNRHLIYSVAKMSARTCLYAISEKIDIHFNYVLHSHVMGPGDDKDSFLQVTLQKLIDKEELIFSSGDQYFDVVSLQDCCLGYRLICEKGLDRAEYWVGSGCPRPLRQYVEIMYSLYPSGLPMQFGKLPYNDIKLCESDFSIDLLSEHTGYRPTMSYQDTVHQLYDSLISRV